MAHVKNLHSGNVGEESTFGSLWGHTTTGHQGTSESTMNKQFVKPLIGGNDDGMIRNGETDSDGGRRKRRRHTQYQIQELENFFKSVTHPDANQREELGSTLGLEPSQVKYWFQNKRTKEKVHLQKQQLRLEKERLMAERESLLQEKARLRQEIYRPKAAIAENYFGKPEPPRMP